MRSVLRRSTVPLVVAALGVALLAGCVPEPEPQETGFTGPNPPGDPTGQPAPTLTATPVGTPIDEDCSDLIPADTIYAYNPNFGLIDPYTPADGSIGASAINYEGVACRWQNQTSGDNIDLGVAHLDEPSLTALKNAAFEDSEMVPTYGEEAYFSVGSNGVGTAIVFQGPYWIVLESREFFEPGDATDLVESVIAGLGA
jgi:hypothetical protein